MQTKAMLAPATEELGAIENSITKQVSETADEISTTNIKDILSQFWMSKLMEDPMAKLIHDARENIKTHEKGLSKIEQTLHREIGRIKGNHSIFYTSSSFEECKMKRL